MFRDDGDTKLPVCLLIFVSELERAHNFQQIILISPCREEPSVQRTYSHLANLQRLLPIVLLRACASGWFQRAAQTVT